MEQEEDTRPCFYVVLGLPRTCTSEDIKRAYRRLALVHHPDRNPGDEEASAQLFTMITEAYDVLSDDEKRRIYDAYGHAAGVDAHETHGAQPPTASARTHGFQEDYGFRHAQDIFESFYGGRNPFAAMNQHMMRGMPGFGGFGEEDDFFGGPGFGMTSSFFGGGGGLFGQSSRSLFDNPVAPFSGGGGGFVGSSFGATAASSSFSSSSSRNGGAGARSRHERTFVRFGLDGTRRSVRETTVVHPNGRREVQVEEEQLGPPQQEGRLAGPS